MVHREPFGQRDGFDQEAEASQTVKARAVRAPEGWARARRGIVSSGGGGRATQYLSETFVRDAELVVVERGTHPALRPTWAVGEGRRVELGALGPAGLSTSPIASSSGLVGNVGFARVAAPSRGVAIAFVRGLRDRPSGQDR